MQVKNIAECSEGILLTYIKIPFAIKIFVLSIFEWPLKTGFTVFYCSKKKEMLLENEGFGAVNEQQLYHGTEASVVDAICRKGFDWRVCGKNGTMYGQGMCIRFSYLSGVGDRGLIIWENIIRAIKIGKFDVV